MGNLLVETASPENIASALRFAKAKFRKSQKKNKRSRKAYDYLSNQFCASHLSAQLLTGSYLPEGNRGHLKERPGKEPRPISVPGCKDYVVQRSILPILERVSTPSRSNCVDLLHPANRGNRIKLAADLLEHNLKGQEFTANVFDLKSYYQTIDRAKLKGLLREICKDEPFVDLVLSVSRNEAINFQDFGEYSSLWPGCVGIPQGGGLSPLLASIYAIPLDFELKNHDVLYLRYADDIVIAGSKEKEVLAASAHLQSIICQLGLEANEDKSRSHPNSIQFLGFEYSKLSGTKILRSRLSRLRKSIFCRCEEKCLQTQEATLFYAVEFFKSWRAAYSFCNIDPHEIDSAWRQILFGVTDYLVVNFKIPRQVAFQMCLEHSHEL